MKFPKTEFLRSPRHRRFVTSKPCSVPGCRNRDVIPHHNRRGGTGGTALKPSDRHCAPLCVEHHDEGDHIGWRSFEVKHGIDLSAIAASLWVESTAQLRGELA